MCFDILIGTTDTVTGKISGSFGRGNLASQAPEECWLLSICQNLGKWNFLWTRQGLGLFDLTISESQSILKNARAETQRNGNLEAETELETIEKCCLLTFSL